MNTLTKLWQAVGTLTANVVELARTVAEINGTLRQRVGLDGYGAEGLPALEQAPPVPPASPDGTAEGSLANAPAPPRGGRRKATAE